jgi:uncharacterized membrane-anchored protein
MRKIFFLIFLFLFSFNLHAINLEMPQSDEDYDKKINSLNWQQGPNSVNFKEAGSKIRVSSNYEYLQNDDANQFLYWINGIEFPNTKVIVIPKNWAGYYFAYSYQDSGYVKIDDWGDIDPNEYLKELEKDYKSGNKQREKNNQPTLTSISWKYPPKLDRNKNTVNYAIQSKWSDNHESIQASSLILGRKGYTTAFYVTSVTEYKDGNLQLASGIHEFNPELEYKSWKPGDKVAAVGIAGLLAATLGVKSVKAAAPLLVVLAALLKKLWWIIILPFIWLGKLFMRSSSNESATSENSASEENSIAEKPKRKTKTKKK